jgi:hypothetical protein
MKRIGLLVALSCLGSFLFCLEVSIGQVIIIDDFNESNGGNAFTLGYNSISHPTPLFGSAVVNANDSSPSNPNAGAGATIIGGERGLVQDIYTCTKSPATNGLSWGSGSFDFSIACYNASACKLHLK